MESLHQNSCCKPSFSIISRSAGSWGLRFWQRQQAGRHASKSTPSKTWPSTVKRKTWNNTHFRLIFFIVLVFHIIDIKSSTVNSLYSVVLQHIQWWCLILQALPWLLLSFLYDSFFFLTCCFPSCIHNSILSRRLCESVHHMWTDCSS